MYRIGNSIAVECSTSEAPGRRTIITRLMDSSRITTTKPSDAYRRSALFVFSHISCTPQRHRGW